MERNTQPDFLELLRLLNERGVEYPIVGGYALAFHGAPRFTADIDLFYRLTPENAERIMQVLQAALVNQGLLSKIFSARGAS